MTGDILYCILIAGLQLVICRGLHLMSVWQTRNLDELLGGLRHPVPAVTDFVLALAPWSYCLPLVLLAAGGLVMAGRLRHKALFHVFALEALAFLSMLILWAAGNWLAHSRLYEGLGG